MARAKRLVRENLAVVDVVVELADARVPAASRDPGLSGLLSGKVRLLVLNKADLADPEMTRRWLSWLTGRGERAMSFRATAGGSAARLMEALRALGGGRRPSRSLRIMVVGTPNVGKSSLLNRLAGRASAATGDRPGVTRGKQWVTLAPGLDLLDLPGILPPRTPDGETAHKLAAAGIVPEGTYESVSVALWLLAWLTARPAGQRGLQATYGRQLAGSADPHLLLEMVGQARGCLTTGGRIDRERAAVAVVKDFRDGRLGRHTLEAPPGADEDHG
jgi:ribosome biogenesis GTPase A